MSLRVAVLLLLSSSVRGYVSPAGLRPSLRAKLTAPLPAAALQPHRTHHAPEATVAAGSSSDELRLVSPLPKWLHKAHALQEKGAASMVLILATIVSLSLSNLQATSAAWLRLWTLPVGPPIGGHVLSLRAWVNEGLMAVFFFVVGLEIKMELRLGSLASVKKAVLPCIAALGGMVTPMAVYLGVATLAYPGSTLAGLTIPMATDIAFAMAIYGFFRDRMPPSASAFLLTLATVDDLGAILVPLSYPYQINGQLHALTDCQLHPDCCRCWRPASPRTSRCHSWVRR